MVPSWITIRMLPSSKLRGCRRKQPLSWRSRTNIYLRSQEISHGLIRMPVPPHLCNRPLLPHPFNRPVLPQLLNRPRHYLISWRHRPTYQLNVKILLYISSLCICNSGSFPSQLRSLLSRLPELHFSRYGNLPVDVCTLLVINIVEDVVAPTTATIGKMRSST